VQVAGKRITKYGITLLAIILIGAFLRVYQLGAQSIWFDESSSVYIAKLSFTQFAQVLPTLERSPPLYFLILHYWVILFGTSEFAVRLLSALFGVLALPMIYVLGRQLFNEEVGLVAALILALSSFNIQYSQEARMYSLMVLLALLSMYFFTRFLQRNTVAISVGYVVSTTLLLYTHVYGMFVIIAQNVFLLTLLFLSREHAFRLRHWIALQALLVAFFAPWISVWISQMRPRGPLAPPLGTVIHTFVIYSGTVFLLALFIGLSILSLFAYQKVRGVMDWKTPLKALESYAWEVRIANVEPVYFLVVWLFALNVIPFIISRFSEPIYAYTLERYAIAGSVALYLLVARGISTVNHRYTKFAVIGIIVVLSAANLQPYYTSITKPQAREATSFIDANFKSGDVVLVSPPWEHFAFDYYNNRTDVAIKPISSYAAVNLSQDKIREIQSDVNGYDRVWLLYAYAGEPISAKNFTLEILNESYANTLIKNYTAYQVYLFEKRA
jgi:mannosyltransferase